jgi:hypothetical protein
MNSPAFIDMSGNLNYAGSFFGSGAITGSGLSSVPPSTAVLPSSTGQGLVTILVQNIGTG